MRLAVISDTHLTEPSDWFRQVYEVYLAPADILVHCGDVTGQRLLDFLGQHRDLRAVAGNCDTWTIQAELPATLVFKAGRHRVGVAHGWGERGRLAATVAHALGQDADIVLFGHSHKPEWVQVGGVMALNPGSLQEESPSLALLDLDDDGPPRVEFVQP